MPLSAMESGPSVFVVFGGVGIRDRRFGPALVVVVACDTVVVTVMEPVVVVDVAVPEFGELLHAAAIKATAIAAAAET
jgi:hypothetical protein